MKLTTYRKVWLILLVVTLPLLLSGCWASIELNNRAFVTLMIIDQKENGIELTLGFPLTTKLIPGQSPSGTGEATKNFTFVSQSSDTIEDAFQKIQSDLSRKITFRQTHNIIVNDEYAKKGIGEVLEFVSRNPYLRLNNNLFMIEGNAKEKLSQAPIFFERFPVSVLDAYVKNRNLIDVTIRDFLLSAATGGDSLVPILEFEKRNNVGEGDPKASLGTGRSAIFRKGTFIQPILSVEETRGALVALSQLKEITYSIDSPTDGKKIGLIIQRANTRINPVFKNNKLTVSIHSEGNANVISSSSNINLHDTKALVELKHALEKIGSKNILTMLTRTQSVEADVLGIGDYVSAKYPNKWKKIEKDWRKYYKDEVDFNVQVEINIKRAGATAQAIKDKFNLD